MDQRQLEIPRGFRLQFRGLLFGKNHLACRRDHRSLQRYDIPLGGRVKTVDGFDLIPEKVQPQRIRFRMGPDIDQFPSAGVLARLQHGFFRLISGTAPQAQQRGGRDLLPDTDLFERPDKFLPAECPLHDSPDRRRDERHGRRFVRSRQQQPGQLRQRLDPVMPDRHAPRGILIKMRLRCRKKEPVAFRVPERDLVQGQQRLFRPVGQEQDRTFQLFIQRRADRVA